MDKEYERRLTKILEQKKEEKTLRSYTTYKKCSRTYGTLNLNCPLKKAVNKIYNVYSHFLFLINHHLVILFEGEQFEMHSAKHSMLIALFLAQGTRPIVTGAG